MHRLFPAVIMAILVATIVAGSNPAVAQVRCRAVDGDTLACGTARVRIIGLDTPEMHGRGPAETRLARAARDRMAGLVAGGVSLQPSGRDRYGRLLAVVRDRRGQDVAMVMVREGLARPYTGAGPRASWCG